MLRKSLNSKRFSGGRINSFTFFYMQSKGNSLLKLPIKPLASFHNYSTMGKRNIVLPLK
jgi:hypothetical protein